MARTTMIQHTSDQHHDHQPHTGDASPDEVFRVDVGVFAGPVDLLVYLIRRNELDIHEIPIARITREFLDYVELIKLVDLEAAGDFIVAASRLLKIKARSMFESQQEAGDEEEAVATRDQLIRYLMEFEKLGGVADKLAEVEEERIGVFPRGGERQRIRDLGQTEPPQADFMVFDLLSAFREVLANAPKETSHNVELLNVTPEMKRTEIMRMLEKEGRIDFVEYVTGQPRLVIVVTFIAMLELIKAAAITVRQSKQFGRITIHARDTRTGHDTQDS